MHSQTDFLKKYIRESWESGHWFLLNQLCASIYSKPIVSPWIPLSKDSILIAENTVMSLCYSADGDDSLAPSPS